MTQTNADKSAPAAKPKPLPAVRLWRGAALFEGASDAALTLLAEASRPVHFDKGQVLFQRGDPGDWVLVLASGRVKLALLSAQGRELVLRHAEGGDILGEMAFLDGSSRSAMAVAMEKGEGVQLTRTAYDRLPAEERDQLNAAAIRYLCLRLRETTDQLETIALYDLNRRLARFLLLTLQQLHGEDLPPEPRLALAMTQGELAAILGASRPKVNRALQELEASGAVRKEGATLVCLPDLLVEMTNAQAD
jgi:CRP/FNR family transcriptional regulator, cyclic AMP receptor protein